MAAQARALLELVRALREGLEALDAPEAAVALLDLRRVRGATGRHRPRAPPSRGSRPHLRDPASFPSAWT